MNLLSPFEPEKECTIHVNVHKLCSVHQDNTNPGNKLLYAKL